MIIRSGRYYMDGTGCLIGPMIGEKLKTREEASAYPFRSDVTENCYSMSGVSDSHIDKHNLTREVSDRDRERLPIPLTDAVTHVGPEVMPSAEATPKLKLSVDTQYKDGDGVTIVIHRFWPGPNDASGIYRYEGLTEDGVTRYYNEEGICSLSESRRNLVEKIDKPKMGFNVTPNKEKGKVSEAVMHPLHYGGKDDPYETIKVMKARLTRAEYIGALKFNVYKYNDRAGKKGSTLEDHRKALFYQTELVDFLNAEADEDDKAGRI